MKLIFIEFFSCDIFEQMLNCPKIFTKLDDRDTSFIGNVMNFKQCMIVPLLVVFGIAVAEERINILSWPEYIEPEMLEKFTKQTGYKVNYSLGENNNESIMSAIKNKEAQYDVVVLSGDFIALAIKQKLLQPIDKNIVPNLKYTWAPIDAKLANYEGVRDYSVNYLWGTTGIGYDYKKIKTRMPDAPIDSLAMVFDSTVVKNFADCGVRFLSSAEEILPLVIQYLGKDPATITSKDFFDIEMVLTSIRPHISQFNNFDIAESLADGDICLAIGWSGDMLLGSQIANEASKNVDIRYSIPKDGSAIWFDQMAIPANAKNPKGAHAFINFMMEPQNSADLMKYTLYPMNNEAAFKLLPKELTENEAFLPTSARIDGLFQPHNIMSVFSKELQVTIVRLWTKFKLAK